MPARSRNPELTRQTIESLRRGELVSDEDFDQLYSVPSRRLSRLNWTPANVAYVAAKLLVRDETSRILDVGSGVGKFCHVGALVTPATFVGVEQRSHFVDEARQVANELGVDRNVFVWANMEQIDWTEFTGIYLFNPFLEQIDEETQLGREFELNADNHARYVQIVQDRLGAMPVGTRVVTYHGFGGLPPLEYQAFFSHRHDGDYIRAWIKAS